ncbi:MAG: C40 family peptidase [Sphingomonadales bacterium]
MAGIIAAPRYVAGWPLCCQQERVSLHKSPDTTSTQVSELLYGEAVTCFDVRGGWAWVKGRHDDYVGYAPATALAPVDDPLAAPTHRLAARHSHRYRAADVKAPIIGALHAGSPLRLTGQSADGGFFALAEGGWVPARHVTPWAAINTDLAANAALYLGAPYRWGGRSPAGVDCSGLVQMALRAAGLACPRDSDQQAHVLGRDLGTDIGVLERGDLVFFPGHVGIMVDRDHIIHANASEMAVSIDPLTTVLETVTKAQPKPPLRALKRLDQSIAP